MKEYIQMFIWIMLFVIVIEMIFPDSDYKKYLKLVLGCIIMYTIIKPAAQFIPLEGQSYNQYVASYQSKLLEGMNGMEEEGYNKEVRKQASLIKDTLLVSIKTVIEREMNVSVLDVQVDYKNGEDEAVIDTVYLIVGKTEERENGKIFIPKIKLGEKSSSINGDEEKLKIKIKTCLKNFYNVPSSNIYITVQKN